MKDIILAKCMDRFLIEHKISEPKESVQFEHFVNYCIFKKYAPDAYADDPLFYESVHVGDGGDLGIDGVLILINDIEIGDVDGFKTLVGNRPFTAKFVFVQAKTTHGFDSGDMHKTGDGVESILLGNTKTANSYIIQKVELIKAIYELSSNFAESPECYIYFVTTGTWADDEHLLETKVKIEKTIRNLNRTSKVELIPVDARKLQKIYRDVTTSIKKEVLLEKVVSFPSICGIDQAFLGLVKIDDLLKLICDEDGVIQNALFYENVRGFLGDNTVNSDIKKTLTSENSYVHFPILNNGVTIVARELNRVGDKFCLSNFQIVNGCQTCNVIHACKDKIAGKEIYCTLKLICTEDPDVIVSITKSTNRQSAVTDEAFESLRKFHKDLQQYYDSLQDGLYHLYYERRAKEFDYDEQIKKPRIVSLTKQIKAFLSMFLLEPHSTHRYYGELLRANRKKMFQDGDRLSLYYTSALCLYKVDQILLSDKEYASLKKYRYHFVMIIGLLSYSGISNLRFNSHEAERVANNICSDIKDDAKIHELMSRTCEILTEALTNTQDTVANPNIRKKDFTMKIRAIIEK
ncbi:MAG: AIPR family protein [Prevotella sp.]|nr:AIPR family protein [Prevotella sp.]